MPLAPLNIRLAAHELEFILNDGEIKALILGPEYVAALRAVQGQDARHQARHRDSMAEVAGGDRLRRR